MLILVFASACPGWVGERGNDESSDDVTSYATATTFSTGYSTYESEGDWGDEGPYDSGPYDSGPYDDTVPPEDDDSNSGSDFILEPDWDENGCGQECDLWSPMDCPEGEKCTAVACGVGASAWDSHMCRDIQGAAAVGEECMYTDGSGTSGNDTCALGSMCWNADVDTGIGSCVAFCTGSVDAPQCAVGSSCAINGDGILAICLPGCEPLIQDCPAAQDLCIPDPNGEGYVCVLDASGGMAPYGTVCNYVNSCNSGLMCIDASLVPAPECGPSSGCCSPMCSISGGEACPGAGQSCEPVFDPQPPGYEDIGVCMTTAP